MINAAADAGADAVKFQFYHASKDFLKSYKPKTVREYVKNAELKFFTLKALARHAVKKGINFVCTPFGVREAEILVEKFPHLSYVKVRAADCLNSELLDYIGNHTTIDAFISIPSTLDTDPREATRNTFFKDNPYRVAFLYCVPSYPPTLNQMHLQAIQEKGFEGFSDHNPDIESALAAIAYGARIIEKHVILNPYTDEGYVFGMEEEWFDLEEQHLIPNPLEGIDKPVSITFTQLKHLIDLGRKLEIECFGDRRNNNGLE